MNSGALLSLIADLYSQIAELSLENAALRARVDATNEP